MANMIYTRALFLHCLIAYVTYYSILNVETSIKIFLLKRGRTSKMVFSCFVLFCFVSESCNVYSTCFTCKSYSFM